MPALILDLETYSEASLPKSGHEYYARHPSTRVLCAAFAIDDQPVQICPRCEEVPPEIIAAVSDPDFIFVAFSLFEIAIWQHVLHPRYGWPAPPPIERWLDLQVLAQVLALPAKLDLLARAIGLKHRKASAKAMHLLSKPRPPHVGEDPGQVRRHDDPELMAELQRYNIVDVETEREFLCWILDAGVRLTPHEQELFCLHHRINVRGYYVDGVLSDKACALLTIVKQELQEQFRRLTGLDSFGQIAKFRAWLAARGCDLPDLEGATVEEALQNPDWPEEVRRALELRAASSGAAATKFPALQNWRCCDGRVRGSFNFHKASTGRWSAGGPQPQNLRREVNGIASKFVAAMSGDIEVVRTLGTPLDILGDIVRAAICAPPGSSLLHMDYSAIESRMLAWMTGETHKLERWAKADATKDPDDDVYTLIGRTLGFPETLARTAGKVCDLAFGYQGGVPAFRRFCHAYDVDDSRLSDDQIKGYRDAWRQQHPRTVTFWHEIEAAALKAMRSIDPVVCGRFSLQRRVLHQIPFLFIRLPSGREIAYPQARLIVVKDRFDRDRTAITFMDASLGRWREYKPGKGAYGGIFCENLCQGCARDVLADAMLRAETAGFPIVAHVHDAVICEVADERL
jgi:DNA polymerase